MADETNTDTTGTELTADAESIQPETTETGAESTTETAEQKTAETAAATPQPSLFAGKFKTAEEAYWHSQGELNALRSQPKPQPASTPAAPKYSTDQLWSLRAQKLQEMTAAQVAGEGDKAATIAANVNWIDNEIQQQNMGKLRGELTAQSALQSLATEGAELLKPYQSDLVPGNPVYEQAQHYYGILKQAMDSGVNLDQILSGVSVQMAVAKTGKATAGVEQGARAEFAGALKQSIKQAVITGAGKAAKTPDSAPDFMNMTDKQFDDYRRKIGVAS